MHTGEYFFDRHIYREEYASLYIGYQVDGMTLSIHICACTYTCIYTHAYACAYLGYQVAGMTLSGFFFMAAGLVLVVPITTFISVLITTSNGLWFFQETVHAHAHRHMRMHMDTCAYTCVHVCIHASIYMCIPPRCEPGCSFLSCMHVMCVHGPCCANASMPCVMPMCMECMPCVWNACHVCMECMQVNQAAPPLAWTVGLLTTYLLTYSLTF